MKTGKLISLEYFLIGLLLMAGFNLVFDKVNNLSAKVSGNTSDTLYVIIKAEESYEELTGLDENVTKRPEFNWLRLSEDSTDGVSGARSVVYRVE